MCVLSGFSCVQLFVTLWTLWPAKLLYPWDSPGKTNSGLPSLSPGYLFNQGLKPCLLCFLHSHLVLYLYHHLKSPYTHTHINVYYIYIYIYIFYLTSFLLFTERLLTICAFVQILLYSQIILLDISYFQKYKNFF